MLQLTLDGRLAIVPCTVLHGFESSTSILEGVTMRDDVFKLNLALGYKVHR